MFSGNKVKFSDFHYKFGIAVVNCCEFSFVGKIQTRLQGRIVPCSKKAHFEDLKFEDGIVGVITTQELAEFVPLELGCGVSTNPMQSALQLHEHISEIPNFSWTNFSTRIAPSATISSAAIISETDVVIESGVTISAGAIILPRTIIGEGSFVGAGVVVGAEPFEIRNFENTIKLLKPGGGVHLGANVEILPKCTIVRATFGGFTEIGYDTKLDCQVHVAHDCKIGKRVSIAACAELSGRVSVGDDSFIGPNVSVSNGINIGRGAHVTLGAVVVRDVADGAKVTGNFAAEHRKWLSFIKETLK